MAIATSEWLTNAELTLPPPIAGLATALDTIVGALLDTLSIAQTILETATTYVNGVIDVTETILREIIAEIQGIIDDFRQLGVYITGDFDLAWPLDNLRGGFATYEQRMIGRLTNQADPSRPNLSNATQAIAAFLYVSADPTSIEMITDLIAKCAKFFSVNNRQPRPHPLAVPLPTRYSETGNIGGWSTGLVPATIAQVQWKLTPPASATVRPFPLPVPYGFLVEVSTIQDGLAIGWDGPFNNATNDPEGVPNRRRGLVTYPDESPFRLYGGAAIFEESGDLRWTKDGDVYHPPSKENDGSYKPGGMAAYGMITSADNAPIPLASLNHDGKPVLQTTFFVRSNIAQMTGLNQTFTATIREQDMPYTARYEATDDGGVRIFVSSRRAQRAYVRVSAVYRGGETFKWGLTTGDIVRGQASGVVTLTPGNGLVKGPPSDPVEVKFTYQDTFDRSVDLTVALLIYAMTRSDLPTVDTFKLGTAAAPTGLESLTFLNDLIYPSVANINDYYKQDGVTPAKFRKNLFNRCQDAALKILEAYGGDVPTVVIPGTSKTLGDLRWIDLDASLPDRSVYGTFASLEAVPSFGPGLNPVSIGNLDSGRVMINLSNTSPTRAIQGIQLNRPPGFNIIDPERSGYGRGSNDTSPVWFDVTTLPNTVIFLRNIFLASPNVLAATGSLLGAVAGPFRTGTTAEPAWIAARLIPQSMPGIESLFEQLDGFLDTLQSGIQTSSDTMSQYVETVGTRIQELEAMLVRIDSLLAFYADLELPSASVLLVEGNGTDGIVQGLTTALNKPSDSNAAFGAGVAILAPGAPTAILELLSLFFAQNDEA